MTERVSTTYVCDCCGKEMDAPFIKTKPYPNEGPSTIEHGCWTLEVDKADYCSFDCLFNAIRKALAAEGE